MCCYLEIWQVFKKMKLYLSKLWLKTHDEPYLCSKMCCCYQAIHIHIEFAEICDWNIGILMIIMALYLRCHLESASNILLLCFSFNPVKRFTLCTYVQKITVIFIIFLWEFFVDRLCFFGPLRKILHQICVRISV